jgi:hypothetical protein
MGGELRGMGRDKRRESSGTTAKTQEKRYSTDSSDFQQLTLATGSRHPPCLQARLV